MAEGEIIYILILFKKKVIAVIFLITAPNLSLAGPWALIMWGLLVKDLKLQITQYLLYISLIYEIYKNGYTHRKNFFSESQLSPIVKSNLVEITRIPV